MAVVLRDRRPSTTSFIVNAYETSSCCTDWSSGGVAL